MRFVTHTAKGVALDLPDTLRLVCREADAWSYTLAAERPGTTPVMAGPDVWVGYSAELVHSWKTPPSPRLIYLAMRRASCVPPIVAEAWGRSHEMNDDVAWYRRRRRVTNRPISSMDDDQLAETFGACLREAIEREGDRLDKEPDVRERELNPLVGGRPLSMLSTLELDRLWVAIDWHRSRGPVV